jgi:large subunit ribosomal protein L3
MLKIKTTKVNLTEVFLENGKVVPVTILKSEVELSEDILNKTAVLVGTSKGKGFTGVMKKWNFSGQQATRGQSDRPRAAGAIGGQTPGRVFLGKKMAGRHGNKRITLKNINILGIDLVNKYITVSGPVPGARNSQVELIIEGFENK